MVSSPFASLKACSYGTTRYLLFFMKEIVINCLLNLACYIDTYTNFPDGAVVVLSWDAAATVLHTSAMTLVFSVTQYYAPVWAASTYTKCMDVHLNSAMSLEP